MKFYSIAIFIVALFISSCVSTQKRTSNSVGANVSEVIIEPSQSVEHTGELNYGVRIVLKSRLPETIQINQVYYQGRVQVVQKVNNLLYTVSLPYDDRTDPKMEQNPLKEYGSRIVPIKMPMTANQNQLIVTYTYKNAEQIDLIDNVIIGPVMIYPGATE